MADAPKIELAERERIGSIASAIATCYRSGLGRCLCVTTEANDPFRMVRQLRDSLSEEGITTVTEPLPQRDPTLPAQRGVWIIENAHVLETLTTTGWMKTMLDLYFPCLRIILVLNQAPSLRLSENLNLLGAIPVEPPLLQRP